MNAWPHRPVYANDVVACCDTSPFRRYSLAQGKPAVSQGRQWGRTIIAVMAAAFVAAPAKADCVSEGGTAAWSPRFDALAPGVWMIPGAAGDADANNRGQVSNLLLVFDGRRTWLLGSGPSPDFGRWLDCTVQARFGRTVTDAVSPWPRPELVLGLAGLSAARGWAHADVAQALRKRCPGCIERLRQRLGSAADDIGHDPVRVPDGLLKGRSGTIGPWRWWLLSRGEGSPVTVWEHRVSGLRFAPGLLWGSGAPDGRDAELKHMSRSTQALVSLPARRRTGTAWVGEQGPPMDTAAVVRQARYWSWLLDAAREGVERGDDGAQAPHAPVELAALEQGPLHTLNWQRAWRQAESRWLQRSLR